MKKFFLFILILILIILFCLNGQLNSFRRASFLQAPSCLCHHFYLSEPSLYKKSATYSFGGTMEDIALLLDILSITIIDIQHLDDLTVYYGYSPRFGSCVNYKGNKCNVQIAYRSGNICISCPLIVGAY